jgi:hypothetical protein
MGKKIDISTQEGLNLLKAKAKFYGHYADNLQVSELIEEIERLRFDPEDTCHEFAKKLGW